MASNAEFRNGACAEYEARLEDFLSGSLSGAEARAAADHLNRCAGCRGAYEEAVAGMRLLRTAAATADPGLGFARVVMARVRAAEKERSVQRAGFWQPFVSVGWRFAATATVMLGALLTYNAGWAKRPQPSVASARPTVVRDIFSPELAGASANADELLMVAPESNHGNN